MSWKICAKESATIRWIWLWQTETRIPSKRSPHPRPARFHQRVSVMEKLAVGNQVIEVFRVECSIFFAILIPLEGGPEQHSCAVLSIMRKPNCVSDNVLCHFFSNRRIFYNRPAAKEDSRLLLLSTNYLCLNIQPAEMIILAALSTHTQNYIHYWDPVDLISYSFVNFVTF